MKKFIYIPKVSRILIWNFFVYLKRKIFPYVLIVALGMFYLYILSINRPHYRIFPLQGLIDIFSGVGGNFGYSMKVIARWEYAISVLILFFMIISLFFCFATKRIFNSISFMKTLVVKKRTLSSHQSFHVFIASFIVIVSVSLFLCAVSFILINDSGLSFRFFPFIMAFLLLAFISAIFCVVCNVLFKSSILCLLFYIGYFATGSVLHELCDWRIIPYFIKDFFFTKATLSQTFFRIVNFSQMGTPNYLPLIPLILVLVLDELFERNLFETKQLK